MDFPEFDRSYESRVLFPLFMNRVMQAHRSDYPEYLQMLDLPEGASAADILKVNGGYRATDNFEVFPNIEPRTDGSLATRFFLQGWRDVNVEAQRRSVRLKPGENLSVDNTNPSAQMGMQIRTDDSYMIGWAPRHLVTNLVEGVGNSSGECNAKVIPVNPAPAPAKQRLLIESGFLIRAVNDQIGINREKLRRFVCQILAPMSGAGIPCQKNDLVPDDGFNPVRHLATAFPFDVPPDFDKIARGLWRENVAPTHSGWDFRLARYVSSWSSGIPSPRSSCSMPLRIFELIASRFSRSQRSCSSCVSRSRSNASSTLSEPVV
jgi:hypothetical protein